MTATLERSSTSEPAGVRPPPRLPPANRSSATVRPPDPTLAIEGSVLALIVAAALPLGSVFADSAWIRPTLGAVLVTLGVAAAARRARIGPGVSLIIQLIAFVVYLGVVFTPDTLLLGVVPTPGTLTGLWSLLYQGFALLPERMAPAAVIPPFALMAVAGAGAIAGIADMLVHAGRAPLKCIIVALTLWAVPLALAPSGRALWPLTVPVVGAIALVLLATASADAARWGRWIYPRGLADMASRGTVGSGGFLVSVCAIAIGVIFAGSLPGYDEPPWWKLRGQGGSTLTANPIVQLRSNLVATGTDTIFTVETPRPVYLRTTALDEYGEFEEWTTSGIRTRPLRDGRMATGTSEDAFRVGVTVGDVSGAELVPMPFQPLRVSGEVSERFQFDPGTGTVVLDEDVQIEPYDSYSVVTAVPRPSPEQLDQAGVVMPGDHFTRLPDNLPSAVENLAQDIVDRADATTPFRQALAIQNELRSWEYSLDPPPGHDGTAMTQFLESRTGYCEQFAGTMAVMLRTLDIPARVAVGFTPGKLLEEGGDTYVVSWSNSHAWVEVLFPDVGWIAFEPTPRGDGNVLVPSSGDPSPRTLEQEPSTVDGPQGPYDNAGQLIIPGEQDFLTGDNRRGPNEVLLTGPSTGSTRSVSALLALAGLLLLVGFGAAWRQAMAAPAKDAPALERVLAAGQRVGRVGAGLNVPHHPAETDQEYLARLAVGSGEHEAWWVLAGALTRARYARSVDTEDAARAERAADQIIDQLLGSLSRVQRTRVALRGGLLEMRTRLVDNAALRWLAARRSVTVGQ